ncbi:MAG TPA: aspartate--tRNA(Asn) ligase [Candidatus Paceibacterota bacterium]|nr:aspartate--tRNA(Asn) ligase [Candidatus Paceibacterota bacterium]
MINRIKISELGQHIGKEVSIAGSVDVRRDHGKLIFIDLRDVSSKVQMVVLPSYETAQEIAQKLRPEWVLRVTGVVNQRPEKMVKADQENGDIELEVKEIEILGEAKELPFDKDAELNLDTYLDYLPLTLRGERPRAIFRVQAQIIKAFRDFYTQEGFTEFEAPKLIGDDAEGGANSFDIEYFGHTAHLAQSPQLYKQIMVGVFERVFATGNVYRAEKHSTTRHINEYTSLDIEMGYITDHTDVMNMENKMMKYIMEELKKNCQKEFALLNSTIPEVPEKIPSLKLREAQEIIKAETGEDCTNEPDLEPQHERWLCEYAKKKYNSDFIFITHFPVTKRPFYTYEDEADPGFTKGADLLFRGIEITTLAQRIHDYDTLIASMEKKNLDPEKFSYYLQAFKYGLPPHGGFGLGLERLTAKLLGIDNVKEATLFPRDLNRIDNLLSQ